MTGASVTPKTGSSSLTLPALHPDARALLESAALAHMVTLNANGDPQVTCVWVGLDGEEIVSAHLARHQKVRNVERDPRVSLSIEATGINGLDRARGRGAPTRLRRPRGRL